MAANSKTVVSSTDGLTRDEEKLSTCVDDGGQGGWITFPFVTVSLMSLTLASSGQLSNMIVYLIREFNVNSIDAAQVYSIVCGSVNFIPVAGAILADSAMGNFPVVAISSLISLIGMILLMLTATIHSLRPQYCVLPTACPTPSTLQYAVLYTAIAVSTLGFGGQRFTIAAMGADQFKKAKEHAIFFNWYFIALYVASITGMIGLVYIQDNVGWDWGFGISLAANAIGLLVFVSGNRYYHQNKPQGSPFTSLARVVVATIKKRKVSVSSEKKAYYYGCSNVRSTTSPSPTPTSSFRFLNRAALITEGDTNEDGSVSKPWRLCTVQQVEDLKTLIRIFPLWSTGILLATPIGIQASLVVLQALTMDRHLGSHFKIPAGSFLVFPLATTALFLLVIDRFIYPAYLKATGRHLTPLKRIGVGHVINVIAMAMSAIVESKRLHVARSHNLIQNQSNPIVPMKALWLVAPLAVVGIGDAFHFPGNVTLFYQEFPKPLKSTATAMIALLVAVGFYLTTAIVDLVRRVTGWLPDNINRGRIDNVFWLLTVLAVINFGYYLTCAKLYKYQNVDDISSVSDGEDSE